MIKGGETYSVMFNSSGVNFIFHCKLFIINTYVTLQCNLPKKQGEKKKKRLRPPLTPQKKMVETSTRSQSSNPLSQSSQALRWTHTQKIIPTTLRIRESNQEKSVLFLDETFNPILVNGIYSTTNMVHFELDNLKGLKYRTHA